MKQNKIEKNIKIIYKQYPECLEVGNIKKLVAYYWEVFDKVVFPLSKEDFYKATNPESIVRARRKVREDLGISDKQTTMFEKDYRNYYATKGI